MQISVGLDEADVDWDTVKNHNRTMGWVVQFPEQDARTNNFIRRKVVLNDANLAIAWELASRLKPEHPKRKCEDDD